MASPLTAPGFKVNRSLEKDIHVKGDGAYVVAPPSTHPNGDRYYWSPTVEKAPIADYLPELL
jgi:Bifunctional DNA primase/polymerase, N-terminal